MSITVDDSIDFPTNNYTVGKPNGEHRIIRAEHAMIDHVGDLIFSNLKSIEFYEYHSGNKVRFTIKKLVEAEQLLAGTWTTFGLVTKH